MPRTKPLWVSKVPVLIISTTAPVVPVGTLAERSISCQEPVVVRLMSGASMNQKNPSAPKDDMADTRLGVDTVIAAMVPAFGVGDSLASRTTLSEGSQALG